MQFYPAGETIACKLLDLPMQRAEWIVTGAEAGDLVSAGFQQQAGDATRFVHAESGDVYQLARQQHVDEVSGQLCVRSDPDVSLENELATRPVTILAMAGDGDEIIDPFGGLDDLSAGVLRHVTPFYTHDPRNLLQTAVWAARLRAWGFRVAHGTFNLMKKIVASGALGQIPQKVISDAVLQAAAAPQPAEFFRVLHRCGALASISPELARMFEPGDQPHAEDGLPEVMRSLNRAAAATDNVSTVVKHLYQLLGDSADGVFRALGLAALLENNASKGI